MSEINERVAKCIEASGLTKTAFAEKINVTQQHVSRISKDGNLVDRTILDICREFNVDENWLRTGEGEMFRNISRKDEISAFMGDVLRGENDFKQRLISVLSRLDAPQWEALESVARGLAEEEKKENADQTRSANRLFDNM